MSYLFDSSTIINIVQAKGGDAVGLLRGQHTLDLAFYESGNAIRTLFHRHILDRAEAMELASDITGAWKSMNVIMCTTADMDAILELAIDGGMAFYDAAFLHHAKQLHVPLVTDDGPFQKKIDSKAFWMDSEKVISIMENPGE
jgi:predicted nucleic acid-binding protein